MLLRLLFLAGLLIAGQGHAIDEDFYIPYADNYGYTYDPKTGQYVKQDPPPSTDAAVQNSNHNATVNPQTNVNPDVTETLDTAKGGIPVFPILIGGGIIVLVAVTYWSLQRKKNAAV